MTTLCGNVPCLVLDSNVVLDWLLFADPVTLSLGAAIRDRAVRWITTEAMRSELEHVLTRGRFSDWPGTAVDVFSAWDTWADTVRAPEASSTPALRCTDPADQKFIDLALHGHAAALISRDKAVLRLARRAERFALKICSPAAWAAETGQPPPAN